jgi:hypothetical protein
VNNRIQQTTHDRFQHDIQLKYYLEDVIKENTDLSGNIKISNEKIFFNNGIQQPPNPIPFNGPIPLFTILSSNPVYPLNSASEQSDLKISVNFNNYDPDPTLLSFDLLTFDDPEIDIPALSLLRTWFTKSKYNYTSVNDFTSSISYELMSLLKLLSNSQVYASTKNFCQRIFQIAQSAKHLHNSDPRNVYSSFFTNGTTPFFEHLLLDPTSDLTHLILCLAVPSLISRNTKNQSFPYNEFSLPYIQNLLTWILSHTVQPKYNDLVFRSSIYLQQSYLNLNASWLALSTCVLRTYALGFPYEIAPSSIDPQWITFCKISTLPFSVHLSLLNCYASETFPKHGLSIIKVLTPESIQRDKITYADYVNFKQDSKHKDVSTIFTQWLFELSNKQSTSFSINDD